jgi:hypothetical protein
MAKPEMIICDFVSPLSLLNSATHYRISQKDGEGPVSKITKRDYCPKCGGTVAIETDNHAKATFATRHSECLKWSLSQEMMPDGLHRVLAGYNSKPASGDQVQDHVARTLPVIDALDAITDPVDQQLALELAIVRYMIRTSSKPAERKILMDSITKHVMQLIAQSDARMDKHGQ